MSKTKYINIKHLAKILKVDFKTIKYWLCHYSLMKYKWEVCLKPNKREYYYKITKDSMRLLQEYIAKKGLTYEERFIKYQKKIEDKAI
jgi:hypothetical protein